MGDQKVAIGVPANLLLRYLFEIGDDCPGHQFAPVTFKTLGRFSPGAMQFLGTVAHGAFPGTSQSHARGRCFDNCRTLSTSDKNVVYIFSALLV